MAASAAVWTVHGRRSTRSEGRVCVEGEGLSRHGNGACRGKFLESLRPRLTRCHVSSPSRPPVSFREEPDCEERASGWTTRRQRPRRRRAAVAGQRHVDQQRRLQRAGRGCSARDGPGGGAHRSVLWPGGLRALQERHQEVSQEERPKCGEAGLSGVWRGRACSASTLLGLELETRAL